MPNLNPKVRDSPCEAFSDKKLYHTALVERWRACLRAACCAGVTDLVCPDAGCGVFQNKPAAVGAALGEVLRGECWGLIGTVWLTGSDAFYTAVVAAVEAFKPGGVGARNLKVRLNLRAIRTSDDCAATDDEPLSPSPVSPSSGREALTESNLRRWLQYVTPRPRRPGTSATASSASSIKSEEDSMYSGTLGGTCSIAGSCPDPLLDATFASVSRPTFAGVSRADVGGRMVQLKTAKLARDKSSDSVGVVGTASSTLYDSSGSDSRTETVGRLPASPVSSNCVVPSPRRGVLPPSPLLGEGIEPAYTFVDSQRRANRLVAPPVSFNDQPGAELVLRGGAVRRSNDLNLQDRKDEIPPVFPAAYVPETHRGHRPGMVSPHKTGIIVST